MVVLEVGDVSYERGTPVPALVFLLVQSVEWYRGTSLIRNSPHLKDHHTALGMVLVYGPS